MITPEEATNSKKWRGREEGRRRWIDYNSVGQEYCIECSTLPRKHTTSGRTASVAVYFEVGNNLGGWRLDGRWRAITHQTRGDRCSQSERQRGGSADGKIAGLFTGRIAYRGHPDLLGLKTT